MGGETADSTFDMQRFFVADDLQSERGSYRNHIGNGNDDLQSVPDLFRSGKGYGGPEDLLSGEAVG